MRKNKEVSYAKGLRNVMALGFVSFFTDVSTEMILGILPQFIIEELKATRTIFGIIEGLAEAVSNILRMISGVLSDRLGKRKIMVFVGYASSNIVKPFFSVARTWTDALAIRVGDRVGKSVRTSPRDALLSESIPKEHMGKAFGIHRTLDQSGAIVGPVFALLLMSLIGVSMRDVFLLSFIPGFIALILLIFFVEERVGKRREVKIMGGVREVLHRDFVLLLTILAVFSIGAFNFSFVLLRADELGASGALIYAVINVAHTGIGIPAGALSDKIGKERVLIIGYVAFLFASIFCMTLKGSPFYAVLIAVVYGIYMGIAETVQRALIPEHTPSGLRATAYGVYYLIVGLCFLVANIVVGALWESYGINVAFTYSSITSTAAIIGITTFTLSKRR